MNDLTFASARHPRRLDGGDDPADEPLLIVHDGDGPGPHASLLRAAPSRPAPPPPVSPSPWFTPLQEEAPLPAAAPDTGRIALPPPAWPAPEPTGRAAPAAEPDPAQPPGQPGVEPFPDLTAPPRGRRTPIRRRRSPAAVEPPPVSRGIPLEDAVRAYQASATYVAWKPRLVPLVVAFLLLSVYGLWSFHPNRTPLGWVLTVIWSMPIVGTLVGIQGAVLLGRRVRTQERMAPPAVVTRGTLVVVVPTIGRHDTYPALERVVLSFVEHLPVFFTRLRVDVVTEEGCEAEAPIAALAAGHPAVRVVTVPRGYTTANGTRFKARANHYAHEVRLAEGEARDDVWVLHMDDDTGVGADTAAALAQFVNRQARASADDAKHLAQGILTYPRENAVNWLTWMADAVRPADDFARFRAVTGSGTPVAGVHGELLMIRASIEARIGWDFGPAAIVEDAQFALTFCSLYPGRSDWFNGRCYGASPATLRDFVRQRERWAWGLVALSLNRTIPFRYRAFMGWSVLTWVLGPLQHLGVVLLAAWALGATTSPVTESVLLLWITNFAYVVWSYWEGLRLNAESSHRGRRRWFEPALVVLLIPVFALIEGTGGLRGLLKFLTRRENAFVVISKPA